VGTEIVGNRVRAKVVKNKVAAPFRLAEFDLMYGTGISKEGSILDLGVEEAIVAKSGAWYTYGTERLGQGREAAKDFLRENPALRNEIEVKVRAELGLPITGAAVAAEPTAVPGETKKTKSVDAVVQ
jgi:recombination protein RecA